MKRTTNEVDITVEIGDGTTRIDTGDKILDHMLRTLFFYMNRTARIEAKWDLRHHLWEDTGITIALAIKEKLSGIKRFGNAVIPMDEALVMVAVDISRPFLNFALSYNDDEGFSLNLVREFYLAFSRTLGATIHVIQMAGQNSHHITEASFKALGKALGEAIQPSDRLESTKGIMT
ncbi:MAG: imidazoleglycerol-phosphate dehydratase HisB [Candidatus Thermoplasmatota archaeon]|nr:imidazoleglycerol-phosphate dehydratase HisB [Candidatus Thermoplasmatota archaeon]MDA8143304.1 imidazoleglycerol-phosphate dehydratase HisB [Thermoplasmatales archaeon]